MFQINFWESRTKFQIKVPPGGKPALFNARYESFKAILLTEKKKYVLV